MRRRKRYWLWLVVMPVLGAAVVLLWHEMHKPAHKPTARRPAPAAKRAAKPVPPPPPPGPQRLAKPPEIVKGVYFTSWSAGLRRRIDYLVDLKRTTALNTLVFDIKDYSGYITYKMDVPGAKQYRSIRSTVRDIDGLIGRLHHEGIYTIARITVFQDPVLAAGRPELAVRRHSTSGPWLDRKGLAWVDPASRAAWDYIVAIASDAASRGFDELNFDYVRFPSDGDLNDMDFPCWDGKTPKHIVIRDFFAYLRTKLTGVPISADLFGLATVNDDDLGIGQIIQDGYADFDYICPMVYPSHFARKFLGFANPAEHPYEVVHYSMQQAVEKLQQFKRPEGDGQAAKPAPPPPRATRVKLRPWLQDFSMGARYDSAMVKAEIQAVQDALGERYAGYLLWSSSNVYTREALR